MMDSKGITYTAAKTIILEAAEAKAKAENKAKERKIEKVEAKTEVAKRKVMKCILEEEEKIYSKYKLIESILNGDYNYKIKSFDIYVDSDRCIDILLYSPRWNKDVAEILSLCNISQDKFIPTDCPEEGSMETNILNSIVIKEKSKNKIIEMLKQDKYALYSYYFGNNRIEVIISNHLTK